MSVERKKQQTLDEAGISASIKKPALQPPSTTAQSGVDPKQEIEKFLEAIAQYNEIGKALSRSTTLQEVGQKLASIAEMAEIAVTNESGDWFDAHTVKRNMKEVKTYSGDFLKLASEADMINQRMTALYDDMGRILERYFEMPDNIDPMIQQAGGQPQHAASALPQTQEIPSEEPMELTEDVPVNSTAKQPDPAVYHATPLPPVTPDPSKEDGLTLRAIKAVHERLKRKNPEMAKKFAALPPQKMQKVVWKLIN